MLRHKHGGGSSQDSSKDSWAPSVTYSFTANAHALRINSLLGGEQNKETHSGCSLPPLPLSPLCPQLSRDSVLQIRRVSSPVNENTNAIHSEWKTHSAFTRNHSVIPHFKVLSFICVVCPVWDTVSQPSPAQQLFFFPNKMEIVILPGP